MEIQPGEICANVKVAHTHTHTLHPDEEDEKKNKKRITKRKANKWMKAKWYWFRSESVEPSQSLYVYTININTGWEWEYKTLGFIIRCLFRFGVFLVFCNKDRYFGALVLADKPKTIPILFTLAVCIMFCLIQRRGHTLCASALRLSPIEEFRESIYWNGHRWRALDKNTFVSLLSARRSTTVPLFSHKPHGQWPNSWRESDLRHCVRWHTYDPVIPFTSKSEKIHYQSISNVLVAYKHTHTRIYSISIQNQLFWSEEFFFCFYFHRNSHQTWSPKLFIAIHLVTLWCTQNGSVAHHWLS